MRNLDIRFLISLLFAVTTQVLSEPRIPTPKSFPRSLEAVLIDSMPSPAPTSPTPTPFLKHLDLRQVAAPAAAPAAAQPAANNPNAAAPVAAPAANNPNAAAPAAAPVAPQPAPAAPGAPAAGVGGAGAAAPAAQPAPGAQANPVTTIQVETVVGGVTKTVPEVYTQTFGAVASAPPVLTGSIGLGTLTGKIGVLKTQDAKKNDGVAVGKGIPISEMLVVLVAGVAALGGGVVGIARL